MGWMWLPLAAMWYSGFMFGAVAGPVLLKRRRKIMLTLSAKQVARAHRRP